MTQPVLAKRSFTIAILAAAQAIVPAIVAVASLYATIILFGVKFDPSSSAIVIVSVLCLVLVQGPREVSSQITSPRVSAVVDVIFRWLLLLAVLLAIGYVTKSPLQAYPRRIFLTWAAATPVGLVLATLAMQELMRRFLISAFDSRSAIIAGYNTSSLELARRLKNNPGMRLDVAGFFDDRSSDRLGMEPDAQLVGSLSDLGTYVKEHRTDVIFIALPIRHVKRVMNLLDDLRDTTASIYYVPDIFVFDLIQARSGEIHGIPVVAMCETPFYGYRGVAKRLTDIGLSLLILLLLLPLLALVAIMVKTSSPGAAGTDEPGGSASACGRPQRGIPQTHQGLHGPAQGSAGDHRAGPGQRLPRRDRGIEGYGGTGEFRSRLPSALVADVGHQDHPAHGGEGVSRR